MKKIFTLIFALAVLTAADAQRGSQSKRGGNDRNVVTNNSRYNSPRNMQWEITRINREYAYKIERVKDNRHLKRSEKRKRISFLEQQRKQEIRRVYARYGKRGGAHARIHIHL